MMIHTLLLLQSSSTSKSPILGYIPIALLLIVALLLPVLLWALSGLLNRKMAQGETPAADQEEGEIVGGEPERAPSRFFILTMVFLVFAIEVVLLFPWAVVFDRLALFGLVEMLIFSVLLIIGYYYAWSNGALSDRDTPIV